VDHPDLIVRAGPAQELQLIKAIPWRFAPLVALPKYCSAKKLVGNTLRGVIGWLPFATRKQLKRLAQFMVQNS
jgi:hypothetical protein